MKKIDFLKPLTALGALCFLAACGDDKKAEGSADAAETAEAAAEAANINSETAIVAETPDQKLSYAIGFQMAEHYSNDEILQLDSELLIQGIKDGLAGNEALVSEAEAQEAGNVMQGRMQEQRAKEQEAAQAEGLAFLEGNKSKAGITTTDSGLQYEVMTKGEGGANPSATDQVTVHYHGTMLDGSVFDSSVQRGEPSSFPLNGVIGGWTEGLQLMSVGDKFKFFIPSELAYGAYGQGSIPAHAVLIFEVELLAIGGE